MGRKGRKLRGEGRTDGKRKGRDKEEVEEEEKNVAREGGKAGCEEEGK